MANRASERRVRRIAWSTCVRVCVAVLLAAPALAEVVVQGINATVRWAPASGAVLGYQVFVSRNGGEMLDQGMVGVTEATVSGSPGEVIQVAVRAWGYPNGQAAGFEWGPTSQASEAIRFAGSAVSDLYSLLDCRSCRRFEMRDLANQTTLSVPYPGGDWELIGYGAFVAGRWQALLRERSNGSLFIGDINGAGMVPYWSHWAPGFDRFRVAQPIDLNGDETDEIILHEESTGRLEIWGFGNGSFVRRTQWTAGAGQKLIGAGDYDGDHQADLWFDIQYGFLLIARFSDLAYLGSQVVAAPVASGSPVDVADYDGDTLADVLGRDETGALQVWLMRGSWSAPSMVMRSLARQAGDENLVPRTSRDIDGRPGAEVVLQSLTSGTVDVALPADPVPGRRIRLLSLSDANWRLVDVE